MLLETLVVAMAIINATIPGQDIPIEVQTRLVGEDFAPGAQPAAQATPSNIGIDAGLIATVAGLAGTFIAGYRKNTSRVDAAADTTVNLAQSLKATDKGTADIANNLASALSKLSTVNPEIGKALETCKPVAVANAEEWNKDVKQYYENKPLSKSEDIGLDKVKTKLKEVNHMTTPTPDDA
jgi:hypothetical protein